VPDGDGVFQVAIIVDELEPAMEELHRSLGLDWGAAREGQLGDAGYRLAFSRQGPPHIELIEAPPGGPWQRSPDGRMRIDHLQWWSDDLDADTRRLESEGASVDYDGVAHGHGFRYFRLASGLRIELIEDRDGAKRANYRARWSIE